MGPISAVNSGAGGSQAYPPPAVTSTDSAAAAGLPYSGVALTLSSEANNSATITAIQSAVLGLLQNIDSDLANSQILRLMIGLMILMALLQDAQANGEPIQQTLSELDGGNGGRSLFVGVLSSSTTVQIEQSVSMTIAIEAFSASGSTEPATQPPGGKIDVSA